MNLGKTIKQHTRGTVCENKTMNLCKCMSGCSTNNNFSLNANNELRKKFHVHKHTKFYLALELDCEVFLSCSIKNRKSLNLKTSVYQ